jgi:hypothetical protein
MEVSPVRDLQVCGRSAARGAFEGTGGIAGAWCQWANPTLQKRMRTDMTKALPRERIQSLLPLKSQHAVKSQRFGSVAFGTIPIQGFCSNHYEIRGMATSVSILCPGAVCVQGVMKSSSEAGSLIIGYHEETGVNALEAGVLHTHILVRRRH